MTDRLARGSLPWPAFPASGPATARPVCRGSLSVEAPLARWGPAEDHRVAALRAGRHAVVIARARGLPAWWPKTHCA
jgi:hypothetical protein